MPRSSHRSMSKVPCSRIFGIWISTVCHFLPGFGTFSVRALVKPVCSFTARGCG
ncbi:MAG: hypothetical protein L6R43_04090 [Planctomycetes bacterium]|nr:hypothetical protein [Planctomycetota bacterium]